MGKPNFSAELPASTLAQIQQIADELGMSKKEVVSTAILQLYQKELGHMIIELQYQNTAEYKGYAIETATGIGGHYARTRMAIDSETVELLECGPNDTERGALQSMRNTINDALFAHGLADEPRGGYNA